MTLREIYAKKGWRKRTEQMCVGVLNEGKVLPTTSLLNPIEQDITDDAQKTQTALTIELREYLEADCETIDQFRDPNRRVQLTVAEVKREVDEAKTNAIQQLDTLFEEIQQTINKILALTSTGGVDPDTPSLRARAKKSSFLHGIGDSGAAVALMAASGAISGGLVGAAATGLIVPILTVLAGMYAGDWTFREYRKASNNGLVRGLFGLSTIALTAGTFLLNLEFADFRQSLEHGAPAYLRPSLVTVGMAAYLATFLAWAKQPAASPELKLLQAKLSELQDEVLYHCDEATELIAEICDEAGDKLEDLIAETEDDIDLIKEAYSICQAAHETYLDDLRSACKEHQGLVDLHRAQVRETVGHSATVPQYFNTAVDLSNAFESGFDIARYKSKYDRALKAEETLASTVAGGHVEIDQLREIALASVLSKRQQEPVWRNETLSTPLMENENAVHI